MRGGWRDKGMSPPPRRCRRSDDLGADDLSRVSVNFKMGRKAVFTFLFFLFLLTSASSSSAAEEEVVIEDVAASGDASVMIGLRTFESLIDDLMSATPIGAP